MRNALLLLVAALAAGCWSNAVKPAQLAETGAVFRKASESFAAKDFAAAESGFSTVIDAGGTNPDELAESYLRRGICRMEKGEFDAALADIERASQVISVDQYHKARGDVFTKKGDKTLADAEYKKAKVANPPVRKR